MSAYRDTLNLPRTEFPMRGNLPAREPGILARWNRARLYRLVRASREGRARFILHDGPPYANGDIHIGYAVNTARPSAGGNSVSRFICPGFRLTYTDVACACAFLKR